MNESNTVDARGLSCPQPPMLTREALKKLGKGSLEVIVDNITARDNVSRMAKNLGWSIEIDQKSEDEIRLLLQK